MCSKVCFVFGVWGDNKKCQVRSKGERALTILSKMQRDGLCSDVDNFN